MTSTPTSCAAAVRSLATVANARAPTATAGRRKRRRNGERLFVSMPALQRIGRARQVQGLFAAIIGAVAGRSGLPVPTRAGRPGH